MCRSTALLKEMEAQKSSMCIITSVELTLTQRARGTQFETAGLRAYQDILETFGMRAGGLFATSSVLQINMDTLLLIALVYLSSHLLLFFTVILLTF